MYHNEKLSQKRLDDLQMLHIDLSRTEWFEHFRDDIIILHNPHIRGDWGPYKLKQSYVTEVMAMGPSTCTPYICRKTPCSSRFLPRLRSPIIWTRALKERFC